MVVRPFGSRGIHALSRTIWLVDGKSHRGGVGESNYRCATGNLFWNVHARSWKALRFTFAPLSKVGTANDIHLQPHLGRAFLVAEHDMLLIGRVTRVRADTAFLLRDLRMVLRHC